MLSKLFFYLLVFLLPIQTGKIFFTSQSFIASYHAFYNSFWLYLTDVVFFGLILAWITEILYFSREIKSNKNSLRNLFHTFYTKITRSRVYWFLFVFWLVSAVSILISRENFLGLYGLVKIIEFLLIFAYAKEKINVSREIRLIFWLVLVSLGFQSGLAIFQYVGQSSAGLAVLGEPFLRPGLRGIAEFISRETINPIFYSFFPHLDFITDFVINVRGYGTLPHSNILAGFLFFGLVVNLYLLFTQKLRISREKIQTIVLSLLLILITTGIVVTFSRIVWLLSLVAIISYLVFAFSQRERKSGEGECSVCRIAFVTMILVFSLALNLFYFGTPIRDRVFGFQGQKLVTATTQTKPMDFDPSESFVQRQLLNGIAWNMIKANPVYGVGVKNFVVTMDDFSREKLLPFQHQPVHNIYLLIASESGLVALFVFAVVLFYIYKNIVRHENKFFRFNSLLLISGLLIIGLFDHYLLSIHQGSLLFWISLGLVSVK